MAFLREAINIKRGIK